MKGINLDQVEVRKMLWVYIVELMVMFLAAASWVRASRLVPVKTVRETAGKIYFYLLMLAGLSFVGMVMVSSEWPIAALVGVILVVELSASVPISSEGKSWVGWWMSPFSSPEFVREAVSYRLRVFSLCLFVSGYKEKEISGDFEFQQVSPEGKCEISHGEAKVIFAFEATGGSPRGFFAVLPYVEKSCGRALENSLSSLCARSEETLLKSFPVPQHAQQMVQDFVEQLGCELQIYDFPLRIAVKSVVLDFNSNLQWRTAAAKLGRQVYCMPLAPDVSRKKV